MGSQERPVEHVSNLGKWDHPNYYHDCAKVQPYGTQTSYSAGANWLIDCPVIHDWGCGYGWFKKVMNERKLGNTVIGYDGSGKFCDLVVDLEKFKTDSRFMPPDGLFMRHVLEHNHGWRKILRKALRSFDYRMFLALYTPLSSTAEDVLLQEHEIGVPVLALCRDDLVSILKEAPVNYATAKWDDPEMEFGAELVFFIQRN